MSESARRCASWVEGRECATAPGWIETTLSRPSVGLTNTAVQACEGDAPSPMARIFLSKNPKKWQIQPILMSTLKFVLKQR